MHLANSQGTWRLDMWRRPVVSAMTMIIDGTFAICAPASGDRWEVEILRVKMVDGELYEGSNDHFSRKELHTTNLKVEKYICSWV